MVPGLESLESLRQNRLKPCALEANPKPHWWSTLHPHIPRKGRSGGNAEAVPYSGVSTGLHATRVSDRRSVEVGFKPRVATLARDRLGPGSSIVAANGRCRDRKTRGRPTRYGLPQQERTGADDSNGFYGWLSQTVRATSDDGRESSKRPLPAARWSWRRPLV
jgi:hypothetical protein